MPGVFPAAARRDPQGLPAQTGVRPAGLSGPGNRKLAIFGGIFADSVFRSQYFSAIAAQVPNPKTGRSMARYSAFLGRRVEVHYRAGDILLPASGTFVADSGRSIFLEQHLTQHGQVKNFRWEIPYQYIVRLEEKKELPYPPGNAAGTQRQHAGRESGDGCGGRGPGERCGVERSGERVRHGCRCFRRGCGDLAFGTASKDGLILPF